MIEIIGIVIGAIFLLLLLGLIIFTGIILFVTLRLNEEVKAEHAKLIQERKELLELKKQ